MERFTKKGGLDFSDKNLSLANELGYSYIYNRLAELEDKLERGQLQEVKNKPLTVEELKSLKRGDWIWRVFPTMAKAFSTYIQKIEQHEDYFYGIRHDGMEYYLKYSEYGTKWIAYKNKEQAEAKLKELKENK